MAESDLVRALVNGFEMNLGRAHAESMEGVEILDEPTHNRDGSLRGTTRANGRPVKPRVSIDDAAAEKRRKYSARKVDDLRDEIDVRNDARGEGEPLIEIAEPGNKPQLVDALIADDQKKEQDS